MSAFCVALFAFAFSLQRRARPAVPLSLEVDKIEFQPSTTEGYDIGVVLSLYARGSWPEDMIEPHWTHRTPGSKVKEPYYALSDVCKFYYLKRGRWEKFDFPANSKSMVFQVSNYNRDEQRFVRRWSVNTKAIPPALTPMQCRVRVDYFDDLHPTFPSAATGQAMIWLRPPGQNQPFVSLAP